MSTDTTVVLITTSLLLLEASLLHANLKPTAAKVQNAELTQMQSALPSAADKSNRSAGTTPELFRYQQAVYQIATQERGSHFSPRPFYTEI
ncbi:MAG: hypothetical protein V7752_17215 [Halopseudomonas sp.]